MRSQIVGLHGFRVGGGGGGGGALHPGGTIQSCAMFTHDGSTCPSGRLQSFARLLSQTPEKYSFNYS